VRNQLDDKLIYIPDFKYFEYEKWSGLLEEKVGITVPRERVSFLQTKIWSRMRELGINSFDSYWLAINNGITGELEWNELLDRLTVHETSFFRHKQSFDLVANDFNSKLINNGKNLYKVWSLSCATGEEPYSLAMLIQSIIDEKKCEKVYYGVTATDISKPSLSVGKNAYYNEEKISGLEPKYKQYIDSYSDNIYKIKDEVKNRVAFGVFNLLKIHEMPTVQFDVIFCQNVLIYFTKEKKLKILDGLKRFLKIGGILVLSPTDIAYWKSENMTRITYKGTLAYKLTR
jgi:chemotaxis protein methyltransferase CheR/type IV pilus assembly protein PilK